MFSFTLFVGKIKIKGDFKGSHKKTDRAFNCTAGQWITKLLVTLKKKKAHYGGQKGTGVSMPWLSLAFKDGVHTSLKHLI